MTIEATALNAYSGIAGAIAGAALAGVVSAFLSRLSMRHERRVAIFQLEIEEVRQMHKLTKTAYRTFHSFKISALRSNDSDRTKELLKEIERRAYEILFQLDTPPLTSSKRFRRAWEEYSDKYNDILDILSVYIYDTDINDRADVREVIKETTLAYERVHKDMTDMLIKCVENFEQGKPTF